MILKKYLFVFSFFIIFTSYSQFNINANPYWEGEIEMADGTMINGYVKIPKDTGIKKVYFKKTLSSKKEFVKRKQVASVKVISPNGKEYVFERIPISYSLKSQKSLVKPLILVEGRNEYVTFYVASGNYEVNEKTNNIILVYKYNAGRDLPSTYRFIRKRGVKTANLFYMSRDIAGFKKPVRYHLAEDPALVEKVENGELGKKNIPEIISIYLKTTEGM